jgi:hypothetical protein
VPVAGEEPHLFTWEQRRRVQEVAEGERAGATPQPEAQRDLDGHDLALIARLDDGTER